MVFNDISSIELCIVISILFYNTSTNLLALSYTGFIYLVLIGFLLLVNDADVYVGFLWVVDLGVGLVFFIFILHFTSFLYQKSNINLTQRFSLFSYNIIALVLSLAYYLPSYTDISCFGDLHKVWSFKINFVNYYYMYFAHEVTDLNLIRDSYFLLNSFEFFLVNFSLLFGLLSSILTCFSIHRIFNFLNYSQICNINSLNYINNNFFIKSQNFTTQQNTPGVLKTWAKNRNSHKSA